ncbi:MAG: DUF6498-containing protein [Micropepsaceae bacterium]
MFRLLQILGTLAVNAIPLAGVIWLGWSVFEVLLLYWFENVAIGVAHAARLAIATRTNNVSDGWQTTTFFAMHYGIFTFVHGVFVLVYFGIVSGGLAGFSGGLLLPVVSILAWQAVQLWLDAAYSEGFKGRAPAEMMFEPYPRVFALHIAVILGGFLIGEMGSPVWALVALVVVKTLSDLFIGLIFTPGGRTPAEVLAALRKSRD